MNTFPPKLKRLRDKSSTINEPLRWQNKSKKPESHKPIASCDANGDPDNAVVVPVSALRSRTCWQDKNECFHSVTIDSIRWDENVTP